MIIGDVYVGDNCYIGPGAVLRGDWGSVVVREGSNVQDNVVIHARPGQQTYLGPDSHVGHGAVLHGCLVEGHVLVGMGAVINDDAVLGRGCIVASGAVVPPGMRVPPRRLAAGVPAEIKSEVDDARDALLWLGTRAYQSLPARYRSNLHTLDPGECHSLYAADPEPPPPPGGGGQPSPENSSPGRRL